MPTVELCLDRQQRKLTRFNFRIAGLRPFIGVSNHLVIVLPVVLLLLTQSKDCHLSRDGPAKLHTGSEWSFDNQALRSITGQLLCTQNDNQTSQQSPEDKKYLIKQQVNVITFIGNQINTIEQNAFKCVASELRVLVLSSNKIDHIPKGAFDGLHSVQVLLLDRNLLSFIPSEDSLGSLKSLRHLDLADNRIEQLERSSFDSYLSGLLSLNLAGNPLIQVHPSSLIHLINLKTLTLSRCSNHSFSESTLDGLQELRFLHLDRSGPIEKVRRGVTKNLCQNSPKLSSLILKSNAIERVPQFAHCQNLLLLDLSYNNIRGHLSENFTLQPNLIDLYLGNNQLESITSLALSGLKKLQVLELQNNHLKQIEPDAFLPVQLSLEELNLSHNPRLSELSPSGLDHLKFLRCYGNHQLRHLPHLKSATQLALTYAYHCCDYPRTDSLGSSSLDAHYDNPDDNDELGGTPSSSLIVRLLHQESRKRLSSSKTFARETDDNLTSELILWPPLRSVNHAVTTKRLERRSSHHFMMDEELILLSEMGRIRRQHSIIAEPKLLRRFENKTAKPWGSRSAREIQSQQRQADKTPLDVRCAPIPGPFLPCKDLFDSWWLRIGIWSVFLLAFLGNILVIIVLSSVRQTSSSSALTSIMWLAHSKRHIDVPRFLVINLAVADLLMAIYLGLLAFVDVSTLGEFKLHAIRWQYSNGCKLAGFLAVLSSELSVFILAIITLERNYAITNAVHLNRRLSLQKAMFIMFLGYAFALAMAIMPLYGISDYRRFSVCLPLDVDSSLSSQIYVITLISINTFSFVLLLGCYLRMYFAIRGSQAWNANDLRIAKRMSILVLTDFLCWMPIIASGMTSLFGYHLIGTEGMKILTIFVLPLNSVANPFLYAITTKKFKRDLGTLHRRTRALVRLECIKPACQDTVHSAYLPGCKQQHEARFQCLTAYNNNTNNNNGTIINYHHKQNHYRHDLLVMSQQHKAGKAQVAKMRLVSGGHNVARKSSQNAANRANANRSATPLGNCHTCSCQQRRQDNDQLYQHQQQVHQRPRIVLETATQTSDHQTRPMLLKKSRSTNSGLALCRDHYHPQAIHSPTMFLVRGSARSREFYHSNMGSDTSERAHQAPALTKVEESMMMTGDESSLYWNPPKSAAIENDIANGRNSSPISGSPANSLLVQQGPAGPSLHLQYPAANASAAPAPVYRAAANRSYLSVDPFLQATAVGGLDIRSASACGHLVSCRVVESGDNATTTARQSKCQPGSSKPSRAGVSGSCDTVRMTSGGGGSGSAVKLSRSIQRLLFGPIAKAWSSIQISLNSSVATNVGQQQPSPSNLNQQTGSLRDPARTDHAHDPVYADQDEPLVIPNCDSLNDDILMMSSPLRRSMHIGERRMSRSCDALQSKLNSDILKQLNSPSHSSGQEQSSSYCDHDDDQRVLLATINRLATNSHRDRLAQANAVASPPCQLVGSSNPLSMRGRCKRCRSWSPALLTKLETCIYQMKNRISSGFASQNAGATRLESSHNDFHQQSVEGDSVLVEQRESPSHSAKLGWSGDEHEKDCSQGNIEQVDEEYDDIMDLNLNLDEDGGDIEGDQFDDLPDWVARHQTIARARPKKTGRLRQQSSVNSDTLSTRTAGTLVTNMSISSDSNASIQLAVPGTNHQLTRLDIITGSQDDDDDDD